MAERMEEAGVADPPLFLDQIVVHDGDVGRCAAKADPSQLEPELQRFPERGALLCIESFISQHSRSRERG